MEMPNTLPLDVFWSWLQEHTNCIIRAGTPDSVLYDDEPFHWVFLTEGEGTLVAQMVRGKRLTGELLIEPDDVTYVENVPGDREGEHLFQLIQETSSDRIAAWFFVTAHGFEEDDAQVHGRVH